MTHIQQASSIDDDSGTVEPEERIRKYGHINDPHGGNAHLIDSWLFKDCELWSHPSFSPVHFLF